MRKKLIWSRFWQKELDRFFLLGLQVFYTEEWLQSICLHSSSFSSPWGVWVLPCFESLVVHQWPFSEGEFGFEHFFKEEGEACWWWLNSKDLEAEDLGRNGGIWEGGGWWNEGGNGDRKRRSVGEKATQWFFGLLRWVQWQHVVRSWAVPSLSTTDTMGLCVVDLRNAERCQGWRMEAYRASRRKSQGQKVR